MRVVHSFEAPHPWFTTAGDVGDTKPVGEPHLHVDCELDAFAALASASDAVKNRMSLVERLSLKPPLGLHFDAQRAFAPLEWFTQLNALELDAIPLTALELGGVFALVRASCEELTIRRARLNDAALAEIARSAPGSPLKNLCVSHNEIELTEAGALVFALGQLRELSLAWNRLEGDVLDVIDRLHPMLLRRLDVSSNYVTWPRNALLPSLEILDLSRTETSLDDLARAQPMPSLRRLDIGWSALWDDAMAAFLARCPFARLSHLGLYNTGFGAAILAAMLRYDWPSELSSLDLNTNSLTDADVADLLEAKQSERLVWLDLAHNSISDEALERLARTERAAPWAWLRIEGNPVTPEGVELLMRSSQVTDACRAALAKQLSIIVDGA